MQIKGSNDLQKGNDVRLIFTADNAQGTAATTAFAIFPGAGNSTAASLPSGVTISGDWNNRADQVDYFTKVVCSLTEIRVETSDTDNYKNTQLEIAERMPNNEIVKRRLYLNKYQISNGNGLNSNIVIPMEDLGAAGMFISPQTQISFQSLKKNTFVAVYATIPAIARDFVTQGVQF